MLGIFADIIIFKSVDAGINFRCHYAHNILHDKFRVLLLHRKQMVKVENVI